MKNKSVLQSVSALLASEIAHVESQVEEFLDLYFDEVFKKFDAKKFRVLQKAFKDEVGEFIEDACVLKFKDEIKADELKSIYKKLAKLTHPDINHNSSAETYLNAQRLYDNGDIEGLYVLYNKLRMAAQNTTNYFAEIEVLEAQIKKLTSEVEQLKNEIKNIKTSKEYLLFVKYRQHEVEGKDFFSEIFKQISF